MPDVVRLRNLHGFAVEVDHVPGPNPEHGEVIDVPGLLVDVPGYREALALENDVPLPPDVADYHWIHGTDGQLRGWPAEKWELVDTPPTVDTKTKVKGK